MHFIFLRVFYLSSYGVALAFHVRFIHPIVVFTSYVLFKYNNNAMRKGNVTMGVFRSCKFLDEIHCSNFQLKIRRTKHDLIIKLITQMDGKSQDESIKPN